MCVQFTACSKCTYMCANVLHIIYIQSVHVTTCHVRTSIHNSLHVVNVHTCMYNECLSCICNQMTICHVQCIEIYYMCNAFTTVILNAHTRVYNECLCNHKTTCHVLCIAIYYWILHLVHVYYIYNIYYTYIQLLQSLVIKNTEIQPRILSQNI